MTDQPTAADGGDDTTAEGDEPTAEARRQTYLGGWEQPYTFPSGADGTPTLVTEVGGLRDRYEDIEDGAETGEVVTVAGRVLLLRPQGRLAFAQLADATGTIQLFARGNATPEFADFTALKLGDWVGVTGQVMKTRKGELSVEVSDWQLLAPARRPWPEKFHGISDPDTRYRQRYVDLWVTEEARRTFTLRSHLVSLTRRFMEDRGYLEVETPVFHPIPGGALATPFTTHHRALDLELYLRIAPELYLKRLVVGGFDKVFEIARVFRNEGISTRHNPEFTMLECYEAYGDYEVHMRLTEELVAHLAVELTGSTTLTYDGRDVDVSVPWRRAPLAEITSEQVGEQVSVHTPVERLRELCDRHEVPWKGSYGPGKLLLELYEKTTEHQLWHPTFVTDYPAEVSPLSRRHRDDPELVERFEGIVVGRELCNGFSELTDPEDQRSRFQDQADQHAAGDDEAMVVDHDYLRALDFGLPPTVGLGIGVDRLVMLLADVQSIRDVVLFPTLRPEQVDGDESAG